MDSQALGDSFLEVAPADAEGGSHVAQAIEFSEAAMHRATQLGEAEPAVSIAKYDADGHLIARAVEEVDWEHMFPLPRVSFRNITGMILGTHCTHSSHRIHIPLILWTWFVFD